MRLGVGGLGSIPGWLLALFAFVVLVTLRYASLALGKAKPEVSRLEKKEVKPMTDSESVVSAAAETAWAYGTSLLAGLPLLT